MRCAIALAALWSLAPAAPVLFVTATPSTNNTGSADFGHFVSLVGGHRGEANLAPRGGDLYIRYDNGTLRNLTAEGGYGLLAGEEICVREPSVHWNGQKAVFSMVVGGTGANPPAVFFQLYEITGILEGQTAQVTKVPGQPVTSNNIQPVYATDGSIIFASDLPSTRDPVHYPQLDESQSTPVVSGLWRIVSDGTGLRLLDHAPSGDFTPFVDSFGRVIFTRWDHLKRDQQMDLWIDEQLTVADPDLRLRRRPFTYATEDGAGCTAAQYGDEVFPENGRLHPDIAGLYNPGKIPHPYWDQDHVPGMERQDFDFFTPWMINEDGGDAEVLNHLGRHELRTFVPRALATLSDFFRTGNAVGSIHQVCEHPMVPGRYYAVDAATFDYHGAGRLVCIDAPPWLNADNIAATITHVTPPGAPGWAGNTVADLFRDPMIRQDDTVWAVCAGTGNFAGRTINDPSPGTTNPYPLSSNYHFKIRQLVPNGKGYLEPGPPLCPDIVKSVSYTSPYWNPPRSASYSGAMWELFPVEVVPRTPPAPKTEQLTGPEHAVLLAELGSESAIAQFRDWMSTQKLALVVSRDVTVRADKQQPYNLKVAGAAHQHTEPGETPEEVRYLQFLAARYVRGYAESSSGNAPTDPGRRLLARFLEDDLNPPLDPGAPQGAVRVGDDGSVAAFVPAERAMTWQLTGADGTAIVRERYWLTFKAGEIRTCTNCHGINTTDVFGNPPPTNQPEALADLLGWWKSQASSTLDWEAYESVRER